MVQVEKITELLILVSDFMVNCTLKNTQRYFCEMYEVGLNKGVNKKNKRTDLVHCQ